MSSLPLKPKVPAFTVPQLPEAMDVLLERAHELMVILYSSSLLSRIDLYKNMKNMNINFDFPKNLVVK